jgi:hypothetical protein
MKKLNDDDVLKAIDKETVQTSIERDSGAIEGVFGLKEREGLIVSSNCKYGIPEDLVRSTAGSSSGATGLRHW